MDVIKIDRSFVSGLPHDESDSAIAELLLQFTDEFDVVTLAEGIKTEAQLSWLVEHGCRLGQGYFFAKPEPLAALHSRLPQRTPATVRSSR
jgi:EAL domain-containing protein (putative c-di-GMP-specific phosphodiesterase class I)